MIINTPVGQYKVGGIYQHYNGKLYNFVSIGKLHESQNIYMITYYQCDEKGELIEIPNVFQPFCTDSNRWQDEVKNNQGEIVKRFKLIK
jgi:hypothetical protein